MMDQADEVWIPQTKSLTQIFFHRWLQAIEAVAMRELGGFEKLKFPLILIKRA